MKTYFRILSYARPLGWFAPAYIVLSALYVVFGVVNLVMLKPMLQIIFSSVEITAPEFPEFSFGLSYFTGLFEYYLQDEIVVNGKSGAILFVIAVLMGSVLLSNFFRYCSEILMAKIKVRLITNLRSHFYNAIIAQDLGFFSDKNRGDIMSRGTVDVQQVENTIVNTLKVLIKDPLMILGIFTYLFIESPTLMLYSMLVLPLAGIFISTLARKLKKRATKSQETVGRLNSVMDETMGGIRVIKAFVAERFMKSKFFGEVDRYARHVFRLAVKQNLAQPVSEIFGIGAACIIIYMGSQIVFAGQMDAASFITFLLMFSQLLNPAKAFVGAFSGVQRGIASAERIFEVTDTHYHVKEATHPIVKKDIEKSISFENVSFWYEERKILKDINLEIGRGTIVALVGPSGGGKSTLSDLIPRFYDPKEGRILLDGVDLRDYKIESLRNLIGVVTQESILFNDTIYNNIAFGQEATREQVEAAAKTANAHAFILEQEQGYDTVIGDRGSKLSGGQRQRISIARALLKNPPILILDEATSALDSESEKLVQEAIYSLMQNRTTLVIAHRLSTIQHADLILVMQDGEIVQRGTHQALLAQGGLYKKLTDMQSF
jgi:ATP-binding cassette, subfamily B, bacterial MsbA